MWGVPERWDPSASAGAVCRVQVWSQGEFVAETNDIIDGSVTEKRTSGPRATFSLSVDPTKDWLEWLDLPSVELRISAGLKWGRSELLCPLGVFPVLPPARSDPPKAISLSGMDRWQLLADDDFTYVQVLRKYALDAQSWEVRRLMAAIIDQTWLGVPTEFWSAPTVGAQDEYLVLDKSRSDTLKMMAESLPGEVFVDRLGAPRVQPVETQPGLPLTDGESGTVITVEMSSPDYTGVYNQVAVSTTAQNIWFFPVFAEITDSTHPAHRSKIRKRSLRYSSPLVFSEAQAAGVAQSLLAKKSATIGWSVSCVPDPARMPGDVCHVVTSLGEFDAVVEEVTHPLGDGPQTVKLSAA